jgi:hypothetical protein
MRELWISALHNRRSPQFCLGEECEIAKTRRGERMAIAIQINLALWGMLVCAQIKMAQLVL